MIRMIEGKVVARYATGVVASVALAATLPLLIKIRQGIVRRVMFSGPFVMPPGTREPISTSKSTPPPVVPAPNYQGVYTVPNPDKRTRVSK